MVCRVMNSSTLHGADDDNMLMEVEEEIPPITYRNVEDDLDDKTNPQEEKRVLQCFIVDLFKAEVLPLSAGKLFKFKGLLFKTVQIRGTVISKSVAKNKTVIAVSDGTNEIDCFHDESKDLQSLRQEVKGFENEFFIQQSPTEEISIMQRGIQMMVRTAQSILRDIPQADDINVGDTVIIIGTLKEYKCRRNIFIKHIVKDSASDEQNQAYKDSMIHLYETVYNNPSQ